jgi:hypothetical protein
MGLNRNLLILQSNGGSAIESLRAAESDLELIGAPNLHEIVVAHSVSNQARGSPDSQAPNGRLRLAVQSSHTKEEVNCPVSLAVRWKQYRIPQVQGHNSQAVLTSRI